LVVQNTASESVAFEISKLTFTIKDSAEGACPVSNFSIKSASASSYWEKAAKGETVAPTIKVAAKEARNMKTAEGEDLQLVMASNAPSGCENISTTIKVVATHNP